MMIKKPQVLKIKTGKFHTEELLRYLEADVPVQVYKNLNTGLWSIRQRGLVKVHTDYICLSTVKFCVGQKGRERVIREKAKNVHAFVQGYICHPSLLDKFEDRGAVISPVTYNPYRYNTFVHRHTEEPILSCAGVDMSTEPLSGEPVCSYTLSREPALT